MGAGSIEMEKAKRLGQLAATWSWGRTPIHCPHALGRTPRKPETSAGCFWVCSRRERKLLCRVFPSEPLSATESAVFETFVVPRYLSRFGELVLHMLLPTDGARVANLGCRTGYPDREICQGVPHASVYGVDRSPAALELARYKATATAISAQYVLTEIFPSPLPDAAFSH